MQACGRLGKDAEVKTLDSGKKVINFSIAVDQGYGDNKTTLWINCQKWGENTNVSQFLLKGKQVAVAGEPTLRSFDGKDGKVTTLQLTCNVITLVGNNSDTAPALAASRSLPAQETVLPDTDGSLPF